MDNYIGNKEIWKDIAGYEGIYQISNLGNVRSVDRLVKKNGGYRKVNGQAIKPYPWGAGYLYVLLHRDQMKASRSIHRLVAKAFIQNPDGKPEVNHIDGDKHNNRVENLEWATPSENERHAYSTGLIPVTWGKKVRCTNTISGVERVFSSCNEAGRFLGLANGTVSAILNRRGRKNGIAFFGDFRLERMVM